jgi:hypothetical protein
MVILDENMPVCCIYCQYRQRYSTDIQSLLFYVSCSDLHFHSVLLLLLCFVSRSGMCSMECQFYYIICYSWDSCGLLWFWTISHVNKYVTLYVLSDTRITHQLAKWFQRRILMSTNDNEGHKITTIAYMTLWIRWSNKYYHTL